MYHPISLRIYDDTNSSDEGIISSYGDRLHVFKKQFDMGLTEQQVMVISGIPT